MSRKEPVYCLGDKLSYAISQIGPGWLGLVGSPRGLLRLIPPLPTREEVLLYLGHLLTGVADSSPFELLLYRLKRYFDGHPVSFEEDTLDLTGFTPFQRQVLDTVSRIPYGEKRSYSWVAGEIRRPGAARAVGQALARNPVPIVVPCHRVVSNGGELGGFSYGQSMKKYLLQLETSVRSS